MIVCTCCGIMLGRGEEGERGRAGERESGRVGERERGERERGRGERGREGESTYFVKRC